MKEWDLLKEIEDSLVTEHNERLEKVRSIRRVLRELEDRERELSVEMAAQKSKKKRHSIHGQINELQAERQTGLRLLKTLVRHKAVHDKREQEESALQLQEDLQADQWAPRSARERALDREDAQLPSSWQMNGPNAGRRRTNRRWGRTAIVYLVRHAVAQKRSEWLGPDSLRPLTGRGERQALGIQSELEPVPVQHIFSSTALRCHETVEGLAAERGMSVEVDSRLDEGSDVEDALGLLNAIGHAPVVLCAGRDMISRLLLALGSRGWVGEEGDPSLRCQTGSIWVVERKGRRTRLAKYVAPRELSHDRVRSRRMAVLDLGSASFSLLVADVTADGRIDPVYRDRAMLHFGALCDSGAGIHEEACSRAVETVRDMRAAAESVGSEYLLPVATSALRDALNGPELCQRLEEIMGAPLRLLSGQEEARIIHAAIRQRLDIGPANLLAVDLGGGSLELAYDRAGQIEWEISLALGVSRLHNEIVQTDPIEPDEVERLKTRVRSLLEPHAGRIVRDEVQGCIATGGTARALARLARAERGEADAAGIRSFQLPTPEFHELTARLLRSRLEARIQMPTVQARRADRLPTGALILATLVDVLHQRAVTFCDWGLREGVLLEALRADAPNPHRG